MSSRYLNSNNYNDYSEYLGARRCCTTKTAGLQGPQGPRGVQGDEGAQGPPGSQGPQGNGDTGDTGPTGLQGARGINGILGKTGDTGPTGPTGFQGPQGEQGQQGVGGTNSLLGSFFNPDNTFLLANNLKTLNLTDTYINQGVFLAPSLLNPGSNSIYVSQDGVYKVETTVNSQNTDGDEYELSFVHSVNGVQVPNTTSLFSISNSGVGTINTITSGSTNSHFIRLVSGDELTTSTLSNKNITLRRRGATPGFTLGPSFSTNVYLLPYAGIDGVGGATGATGATGPTGPTGPLVSRGLVV